MNYTELTQAIKDYCENDETTFVNNIPVFVKNAEKYIYNNVRLPAFRKNSTANATASNKYLATPTDFLSVFELAVIKTDGLYEYLLPKDVSYIRQNYPDPTYTALPKYYALFDDTTFILAPTPDSGYSFELHYKYRPASLTAGADSGTTWLSTNAPDALLYGTLVEAATFLKVPEEVAQYEQRFGQAIAAIKDLGEGYGAKDEYRYDISKGR